MFQSVHQGAPACSLTVQGLETASVFEIHSRWIPTEGKHGGGVSVCSSCMFFK